MDKPKRKFCMSRVLAAVLTVLLLLNVGAASGGLGIYFDMPSFLLVILLPGALLLGTFGRDFLRFIPDSVVTLFMTPEKPIERYADIARFGSRYAISAAAIVSLMGIVGMLTDLSDPSSIGVGIATAVLPLLYGLIMSELYFGVLYKVYSEGGKMSGVPPLGVKWVGIGLFVILFVLVMFVLAVGTLW
jgi:hypothetical protein